MLLQVIGVCNEIRNYLKKKKVRRYEVELARERIGLGNAL